MIDFILGFIAGAVVMDFAWAWRLGLVQALWQGIKSGFNKND